MTRTRNKDGAAIGAVRRQSILALLMRGEVIAVGDLAERFRASRETIRRDIRSLEQEGLLRRVHGGVQPLQTLDLTARRPIVERLDIDRDAKMAAAKAALHLCSDDMTVFLDGGSTLLFLAEALAESGKALNVTTHMINIATVMAESPNCTVTLIGGIVNRKNYSLGGPEVIRSLQERLFDLTIMGGSALNLDYGFLGPSRAHVDLAHVLAERSPRVAFVMDRGKLDRSDAHIMLPLARVSTLATDGDPTEEQRARLEGAGVTILTPEILARTG